MSEFGDSITIGDIEVRPDKEEEVYCVADSSLFVSGDNGSSWAMIAGRQAGAQVTEVLPLRGSHDVIVGTMSGELYFLSTNNDSLATSVAATSWALVKSSVSGKE